jgi:hypothetical protein
MSSTPVTPTLFVGDMPAALNDCYRAKTTGEAIELIRAGLNAVLPHGRWDLAEDVLRSLTDDHAHVLQTLHFAMFGQYAAHQCDCPSCLAGVTRRRRNPDGSLIWYRPVEL